MTVCRRRLLSRRDTRANLVLASGLGAARADLGVGRRAGPYAWAARHWREPMLHVFGFEKVGVAVGDLYFVNPQPGAGQEGAERGVRLEVRLLASPPKEGSLYASRPILVDQPIWRADLLESVVGGPGTWDRTHHHPKMRGWEPGFPRVRRRDERRSTRVRRGPAQ